MLRLEFGQAVFKGRQIDFGRRAAALAGAE